MAVAAVKVVASVGQWEPERVCTFLSGWGDVKVNGEIRTKDAFICGACVSCSRLFCA